MSAETVIISIVCAVFLIGLAQTIWSVQSALHRIDFTSAYLADLSALVRSDSFDGVKYFSLTQRVNRMQRELGDSGIMSSYRPPYANYMIHSYQLLINTLPEIRTGQAHQVTIGYCEDALIRHLGDLDELLADHRRDLFNPITWAQQGVVFFITLPLLLAHLSGLVQYGFVERVGSWTIVRFLSFVIVIIGLVGSIVTIVLGWDQFSKMLPESMRTLLG